MIATAERAVGTGGSGGRGRAGEGQSSANITVNDNVIMGAWVKGVCAVFADECETSEI